MSFGGFKSIVSHLHSDTARHFIARDMPFATHDEYLATLNPEQRLRLEQVSAVVQRLLPEAARCISYNLPAFKQGRVFFYFAAFKKHVGIYPPIDNDQPLILETTRFRGPKGNLSFPHSEPLPIELIGRIALALHQQYSREEAP